MGSGEVDVRVGDRWLRHRHRGSGLMLTMHHDVGMCRWHGRVGVCDGRGKVFFVSASLLSTTTKQAGEAWIVLELGMHVEVCLNIH